MGPMLTPRDGLLGGDRLRTSNTVAMIRQPDGRVRPLLFDSSPLLPSAVMGVLSVAMLMHLAERQTSSALRSSKGA
ncbi:hypothetical protein CryarDRAFT_3177 [Cryptosporangium arvum DSM 44712]|uniref:Uncharacterized protein n=1 Tax=Cryptosporangium arvum DSM 44712 TaxID=927661 RepID=A0A010YPC8_9ACTN|nr:hypothetical protein CryarDRAFT_3177 [Cryptosporangium arvum DSM 44712]